jgi:molybdopterin molybdotransferase
MLGRGGLTPVREAQRLLLENLEGIHTGQEETALEQAVDRILSQPVTAHVDLPDSPRSTMDGFAVSAADTFGASESMPCYLNVTGEVRMGQAPAGDVGKGCCFRIPTGGLLPGGADCVIMLEHTVPVDESMIEVVKGAGAGANIVQPGEDIKKGQEALPSGHLLRPQDIGLLAGIGTTSVTVYKKVRVAIVSTGDEIVSHTDTPGPGRIRNINSLALAGQVQRSGALPSDYGIVSDSFDIFLSAIEKAAGENDIVLFSGGSSVGVRDLGEQVMEALGPPGILVHGVALKPGKPVLIGMSGTTPVFGLPGHPVSAMVCFDFFVKPAIQKIAGFSSVEERPVPTVQAKLARNINSAPGRLDVIRVRLERENGGWTALPVLGKSGAISTLSKAHGYFVIEEDCQGVSENSEIMVQLLQ